MSNGQRSLWTFLLFALIGPFAGAVVVVVGSTVLAQAGQLVPAETPGDYAIRAFVLGTFVAAIVGAGLAALTSLRGGFGWLEASVAGVLGFMAVALGSGAIAPSFMTAFAFLSACVALLCRALLVRINILPSGP